MKNHDDIDILTWNEAAPLVAKVNPKLAETIDQINPSEDYTLYKIRYSYGDEILKRGIFQIPENGNIVPLMGSKLPDKVKQDLHYNYQSNPLLLVLNNSSEIFLHWNDRIIPFSLMEPGSVLGGWGVLDEPISQHPLLTVWDMTAGARSLFFLPKVSDKVFHTKLMNGLGLNSLVPRSLNDQWTVFRDMARNAKDTHPWHTEILCFSGKWFQQLSQKAWQPLRCFLLDYCWKHSDFLRNKAFSDLIFSIVREQGKIEPNAYANDIIKTLFAISAGNIMGFAPALDNKDAPISLLQDMYVNGGYKLNKYPPILMTPKYFKQGNQQPVYYSLNHPTGIEYSLKATKRASIITDLTTINRMLGQYQNEIIISSNLTFSQSKLLKVAQSIKFTCFHDNPGKYSKLITHTSEIPSSDNTFLESTKAFSCKTFPTSSEFIRGCIRIS